MKTLKSIMFGLVALMFVAFTPDVVKAEEVKPSKEIVVKTDMTTAAVLNSIVDSKPVQSPYVDDTLKPIILKGTKSNIGGFGPSWILFIAEVGGFGPSWILGDSVAKEQQEKAKAQSKQFRQGGNNSSRLVA